MSEVSRKTCEGLFKKKNWLAFNNLPFHTTPRERSEHYHFLSLIINVHDYAIAGKRHEHIYGTNFY